KQPASTELYTLSLHDALPISKTGRVRSMGHDSMTPSSSAAMSRRSMPEPKPTPGVGSPPSSATRPSYRPPPPSELCAPSSGCVRSEEHTSELQSRSELVCRLL